LNHSTSERPLDNSAAEVVKAINRCETANFNDFEDQAMDSKEEALNNYNSEEELKGDDGNSNNDDSEGEEDLDDYD